MILLDEAVDRFNEAGGAYGVGIRPWTRRVKARERIAEIERELSPLGLPRELRAFWSSWNPASIQRPALDGFIPLEDLLERREMDHPPCPAVLLPIADWTHSRVWMELESGDHPGGRIFHSYHDETELTLWAFGISGLLDVLSRAFERDLIDDRSGALHARHFEATVQRCLDETVGTHVSRRFEGMDRSSYPDHWLLAEGLPLDHFELRGANHTVRSFRLEREISSHLTATLVGRYETSVGGGPLHGCVGTFEDDTGSLQVFVPQVTGIAGALGPRGAVEIDVLAVVPNGSNLDSLSAKSDLQQAVSGGAFDYGNDLIVRLMQQMKYLDTSIVVTGLRPIH
jgi:hypothetical protein